MNLNYLISYVEIVNMKSFSKAADKLYITQPAITAHIKYLEKEFETKLINRSNKEFSLTPAGKIVYNQALNIINLVNNTKLKLLEQSKSIKGELKIYSSTIPYRYLLPRAIKEFSNEFPDINIKISKSNSNNIIELIKTGVVNYGIVGKKIKSEVLEFIELIEDEIVFISSKIFNDSCIRLDQIKKEPLIFREEGSSSQQFINNIFIKNDLSIKELDVHYILEDNEVIKNFVELGLGSSLISKIAVNDCKNLNVYPLSNDVEKRKFYLVFHKNRYYSPVETTFIEYASKFFKTN